MSPRLLPLKRSISVMSLFPSARKRTPTSLMRRAFLMTVRALILVRLAPRHDPFESRPLKPFIPVADLNRSWDEAGTQGLSRAPTPGPGFWLRGVDRHSSAARLGSLLAIHRGNRPLQRPRLFTRQPPLSEMGVRQQGRVKRFSRKRDGSSPWSPPLDATRFRPCHLPEMASGRRRLPQQSGVSGSSCLPYSFYEDWMAFVRELPDEIQTHPEPGLPPREARFARQETRLIQ